MLVGEVDRFQIHTHAGGGGGGGRGRGGGSDKVATTWRPRALIRAREIKYKGKYSFEDPRVPGRASPSSPSTSLSCGAIGVPARRHYAAFVVVVYGQD